MKTIFHLLLVTMSQFANAIGHDQGNGGVVVQCPGYRQPFSLDYVLAQPLFDKKIKLVSAESAESSLARISNLLKKNNLSELNSSFSQFVANLKNTEDETQPYLWENSYSELEELDDQNFARLPSFCNSGRGTTVRFYQAVIRKVENPLSTCPNVVFHYDRDAVSSLGSLQRSFLFVHEWLWSVSKDVVQNRKINYFLHTELMDTLSPQNIHQRLKSYGLDLPDQADEK